MLAEARLRELSEDASGEVPDHVLVHLRDIGIVFVERVAAYLGRARELAHSDLIELFAAQQLHERLLDVAPCAQ